MIANYVFQFGEKALYSALSSRIFESLTKEELKVYLLLAGMAVAAFMGPVFSANGEQALDNDTMYSVPPAGAAGSGEVDAQPEDKKKKYREKITIQKAPGARYERIIVTPPAAPVARPMPKPAIMPEVARPSGGNDRWKKYDDMTISPSDSSDPSASFYLPPN